MNDHNTSDQDKIEKLSIDTQTGQHPVQASMPDRDLEIQKITELKVKLKQLANLFDDRFKVPGTEYRFGLDGIIGLIPVIGDTFGLGLSSWLIAQTHRVGAPKYIMVKMVINVIIDWLIGLIPFIGDLLDFNNKANVKNMNLLMKYLDQKFPELKDHE